jgi:hypothetical protein
MSLSPLVEDAVTPHMADILQYVENGFKMINYDQHIDDIEIPLLSARQPTTDAAEMIISTYREHITSVLKLQGITLTDPDNEAMDVLATILDACAVLGTVPYADLIAEELLPPDIIGENTVVCFCEILSRITKIDTDVMLRFIKDVNPSTIEAIKNKVPILDLTYHNLEHCKQRFLACALPKENEVTDIIKQINYFGYNPEFVLKLVAPNLKQLLAPEYDHSKKVANYVKITESIVLLVLGSYVEDNELLDTMFHVSELLCDSPEDTIVLNKYIHKLVELLHVAG